MKRCLAVLALVLLAACGADPVRFDAAPAPVTDRVSVAYGSISVREVSLPTYAAAEEIAQADAGGRVLSSSDTLWADIPTRAITLDLARTLRAVTGVRVAPDPWPYQSRPEATVDVRFEDLLPDATGTYRASGLYFVAPDEDGGREHAHAFDISAPFDPEAGFAGVAAARAQVINQLALDIARTALR